MQIPDLTVPSVIVTIALSIIMGCYLFMLWFKQEQRLNTDLPLMFGITFLAQAINNVIRILPMIGVLEMTMELFRLRAIVIIGTAFPMLGVVLHIWFPRFRRHHLKILGAMIAYWVFASLVGPTEQTVILLVMPLILLLMIGMMVTFAITWKTGRLKEIRSDIVLLSFVFGMASQIVATQLVLNNLFTVLATFTVTIGLVNPWKPKEWRSPKQEDSAVVESIS